MMPACSLKQDWAGRRSGDDQSHSEAGRNARWDRLGLALSPDLSRHSLPLPHEGGVSVEAHETLGMDDAQKSGRARVASQKCCKWRRCRQGDGVGSLKSLQDD